MANRSHPLTLNVDRLMSDAVAHHQAGRLPEAERAYNDVLKSEAGHADALRLLGALYIHTARFDRAEELLQKAHKAQPGNPETLNNLGVALRNQGKLAEAVSCFERAVALKPDYVTALNNAATALQALNRLDEAIACYEKAIQLQPGFFAALCNLGNALQARGKSEVALERYMQALQLKPDSPELFVNMGAAWWDLNQLDKAVECYEQALRLKPDYVAALVNYGTALWGLGRPEDAAAKYWDVLAFEPNHAEALTNLGALLHDQNRLGEALTMYENALGSRPDFVDALWRKSLIFLTAGNYAEGWKLYETGLGKRNLRGLRRFHAAPWDGSPASGKRLLIWGEQGLGDCLQFIRYAALCKPRVGKVLVLCPKPLARLFRNCPFIDAVSDSINLNDFDEHIAMMSLPAVFGTTLETVPAEVPYLHVAPPLKDKWAAKLSYLPGLKVGLIWAGNARVGQINANAIDRRRSLELNKLMPLFDIPNMSFVSLQLGPAAQQITQLGLRDRMTDMMAEVEDFADTAAIIANLDLVISVDTSVAHLAGALAKPVWILSRYDACWRWLGNRETSPWYPTARIFGQTAFGEWDSVIEKLRDALAAYRVSG